ncbi:MAG TPA: YwmB family TATA-box binding protein [Tissierellaceae bacterium]|nr:YwmB family TATA-box binding protein [Tissierellaceae bacterium]
MKKLILVAIIITLLIPLGSSAQTEYGELDILYSIMNDLGGEIKEEDIIFNGVILDRFIMADEMEALGADLVSQIGLVGQEVDPFIIDKYNGEHYTKEVIFEDNFGQICYIGQDMDNNKIALILNSYKYEEELNGDTYLYLNLVKDSDFLIKNDIIEGIKLIYQAYDSKVEIMSCLIGETSRDMAYNDRVKKIKESLEEIDGEIVEEFSDLFMISYTAYTPYIDKYIKIGSEKINLNIAIRHDEINNKDYIWLGTPIITVGY